MYLQLDKVPPGTEFPLKIPTIISFNEITPFLPLTLGRLKSASDSLVCRFKDARISNLHAKITLGQNNKFFLTDLGSTNCTMINNMYLKKFESVELKDADHVTFGPGPAVVGEAREGFRYVVVDEYKKRKEKDEDHATTIKKVKGEGTETKIERKENSPADLSSDWDLDDFFVFDKKEKSINVASSSWSFSVPPAPRMTPATLSYTTSPVALNRRKISESQLKNVSFRSPVRGTFENIITISSPIKSPPREQNNDNELDDLFFSSTSGAFNRDDVQNSLRLTNETSSLTDRKSKEVSSQVNSSLASSSNMSSLPVLFINETNSNAIEEYVDLSDDEPDIGSPYIGSPYIGSQDGLNDDEFADVTAANDRSGSIPEEPVVLSDFDESSPPPLRRTFTDDSVSSRAVQVINSSPIQFPITAPLSQPVQPKPTSNSAGFTSLPYSLTSSSSNVSTTGFKPELPNHQPSNLHSASQFIVVQDSLNVSQVTNTENQNEPELASENDVVNAKNPEPGSPTLKKRFADILECSVCLSLLLKPYHVIPCLHTFCFDCIDKWMKKPDDRCPYCRTEIQGKPIPAILAQRMVDELMANNEQILSEDDRADREERSKYNPAETKPSNPGHNVGLRANAGVNVIDALINAPRINLNARIRPGRLQQEHNVNFGEAIDLYTVMGPRREVQARDGDARRVDVINTQNEVLNMMRRRRAQYVQPVVIQRNPEQQRIYQQLLAAQQTLRPPAFIQGLPAEEYQIQQAIQRSLEYS
ncbi:E3 ubiquitin ligase [Nowakowskiella sp. JEL0407]|nr:E3 ubiquitin ligase [Nowakowskiella sp. JEL0407]